jgi:hypothetical protein
VIVHSVATFFTAYEAGRGKSPVEAIAVVVGDGPGPEPVMRFIVVDEGGQASLADARDLDLYGVWLGTQEADEAIADDGSPGA